MSVAVTIKVDVTDVEKGLTGMARKAHTLRQAFTALKKPLRADQREHSAKKEGPEGKWPPRKKIGGKRRKLLGKLPAAITVSAEPHRVVAQSRVPWSGVHQTGGRVGRGVVLPARPFLWVSDELLRKAADVLGEHVAGGFYVGGA